MKREASALARRLGGPLQGGVSTYRFWIQFSPDNVLSAQVGLPSIVMCCLVAAVLAIPQVEAFVGVDAIYSVPLILLYPLWIFLSQRLLKRRAKVHPWAFHLLNLGDVFLGLAIAVALPIASNDPASPLWVLAVMFAGMNGADYDYDPSILILLGHSLSPLAGIPVYLALGNDVASSVGGPALYGVTCFVAYHFNAMRRSGVRKILTERDELRVKLAEEKSLRERERIARDLHDSVGATLSTAALYADILARQTDPENVRRLSEAIAQTTREGITELRGLLDALSPDDLEAEAFCDALRAHAQRLVGAAGLEAEVVFEGDATMKLSSALRFGIARVFQEAISNSVRHAKAKKIMARLTLTPTAARLELADDGCGFDPRAEAAGRGVRGMRARMKELGGSFEIGAGSTGGTRIVAELPLAAA